MDTSVTALEEAISIRRQIDNLEKRLSSILGGAPARTSSPSSTTARSAAGRYFSPTTRAKLASAAKARWARQRGPSTAAASTKNKSQTTAAGATKTKGQITPAGRRRLSQLMKARWAARRKAGGTKAAGGGTKSTSNRKTGTLTPAGRRRLSELMKARWAARRKAGSK